MKSVFEFSWHEWVKRTVALCGVGGTSVVSGRHQERRLSTGIAILVSHAYRNRTDALQYDEAWDTDKKVGVQLTADSGTEVTFTVLTVPFTKTHQVSLGWPTSTYRRTTSFLNDSLRGHTCVYIYRKGGGGAEFNRTPLLKTKKLG
jgi:hypothetical protein